jgi:hypothetical protein
MFAKQVKDYCKNKGNANTSQCKRNMMVFGMQKLNGMEESHLDAMDPYQRDSDTIRKYHDDCEPFRIPKRIYIHLPALTSRRL